MPNGCILNYRAHKLFWKQASFFFPKVVLFERTPNLNQYCQYCVKLVNINLERTRLILRTFPAPYAKK